MNRLGFIALALLLLPRVAVAELSVTEVAWMGTEASASDEWFELYNDSTEPLSLAGYSMSWGSEGAPRLVNLSGVVSAGGYVLLERTSDDSVPTVPADFLYTGALSNSGEVIKIKKDGVPVFTLDASSGWPGGDNATKETMQWNGTAWITAPATPKSPYLTGQHATTTETATTTEEIATTTLQKETTNQTLSSHSSPVALSTVPTKRVISISLGRDRLGTVNVPLLFSVFLYDANGVPFSGNVSTHWSFGDGESADGVSVRHTYSAPGEYVVVATARVSSEEAVSRNTVLIIDPVLLLFSNEYGLGVTNKSREEVNLGGFLLGDQGHKISFPEDTIVKKDTSIIFSTTTQQFLRTLASISIYNPLGRVVAGPFVIQQKEDLLKEGTTTLIRARLEKEIADLALQISHYTPEKSIPVIKKKNTALAFVEGAGVVSPEKKSVSTTPIVVKKEPSFLGAVAGGIRSAWRAVRERVF